MSKLGNGVVKAHDLLLFFSARPPLARQSGRSNRHLTSHFQSMVMRPNFATEKLCFFLQAPHSFILSNDFTK